MKKLTLSTLAAGLLLAAGQAFAIDVVYHIAGSTESAVNGMRNVRNHISDERGSKDKVVVVVNGNPAIESVFSDTKDPKGVSWATITEELMLRGVEIRACEITLKNGKLDPARLATGVKLVPSGSVEVAHLQAQGYSYIRP